MRLRMPSDQVAPDGVAATTEPVEFRAPTEGEFTRTTPVPTSTALQLSWDRLTTPENSEEGLVYRYTTSPTLQSGQVSITVQLGDSETTETPVSNPLEIPSTEVITLVMETHRF
jgi:hypothetical protein